MSLTIPVYTRFGSLIKELSKILPTITFHEVKSPEQDQYFKNSEILICDFDCLGPHLYDLPKAKWVQGTWAGVDALTPHIQPSKTVSFKITRFTGKHLGHLMSEYVVTNIVNWERKLFQVKQNQGRHDWNRDGKISDHRAIFDLTIGILGVGTIGAKIGLTLHGLGAEVVAFGRQSNLPPGEYPFVSRYYTKENLGDFLKQCDYAVNVLPSTPDTNNLLDNAVLKNCQERKTVFINIGRGNVISENSLVTALNNNWISGAILDVFEKEPLSRESPLWDIPQVFITPHIAGQSRPKDVAVQFRDNLALYQRGDALPAPLDLTKRY